MWAILLQSSLVVTAFLLCQLDMTESQTPAPRVPANCPEKTYRFLVSYGYLNPDRECIEDDIRTALTKFQEISGIEITGECDNITIAQLFKRRCGCEDIVKMQKKMPAQNLINGPLAYRIGNTKWSKKTLSWTILKYPQTTFNKRLSQAEIKDAMKRALQIWADVTKLSFVYTAQSNADITIKFERMRHTSQPPYYDFDGQGNVLAHAFFPESGVVHFDDDEQYVLNSNQGTELYIVAAHEFGHTLGISHSTITEALMAPYYRYSEKLELHPDDIAAVQAIYGRNEELPPTAAPVTPAPTKPTTRSPDKPDLPAVCSRQIKASFKLSGTTYIFTREHDRSNRRWTTYVYKVRSSGIDVNSKTPINEMFLKLDDSFQYPRAYPFRVDAAAYVPDQRYVFLFSGTRAYRYTAASNEGPFYLDDEYPRWMNVREFPERPRAAVALPYSRSNIYYMLIFGSTMVWDWNFYTGRVGAWAYPIEAFGRSMPTRPTAAYLQDSQTANFIQGDKYYEFSISQRRVLSTSTKSVKADIFKGPCM